MNANLRKLAAAAALLAAGVAFADDDADDAPAITFERYKTIVDRCPFGPPPPNFDPTDLSSAANSAAADREARREERELSQEENKLKSAVRLCAFNLTPERRVMVGFVDNSVKPPKSFYMPVGDTRDGWTVVSADVDKRTAVLEKGGIEVDLEFPKPGAAPAAPAAGGRPGPSGRPGGAVPAGGALERLRARRDQSARNAQEEEDRKRAAAEKENADRAAAAAEREQQREQLLQIQEELRRQREQREKERAEARAEAAADSGAPPPPPDGQGE